MIHHGAFYIYWLMVVTLAKEAADELKTTVIFDVTGTDGSTRFNVPYEEVIALQVTITTPEKPTAEEIAEAQRQEEIAYDSCKHHKDACLSAFFLSAVAQQRPQP